VDLILTVLTIVAPVGLLGMVGFLWVRTGHDYDLEFVTRLAMTLSIPALIFTALMKSEVDPAALRDVSLAAALGYGVLALVFLGVVRLLGLPIRTWLAPMIFGNTGNVGLPLALFAFGEAGLGHAVVIFAVMMMWHFTLGLWLVAGGGSPWRLVREPAMIGTVLGGLFLWQGWQTPDWLTKSLELIGQIAIPMMLITLGVAVARLSAGHLGRALAMTALRFFICAGVATGLGVVFALTPVAMAVLILQFTTPVAVTSYMLAAKYGADADTVASMVIASTLLSIGTLPLTLAFLI
jgi:malate permease and related proteins